MFNPLAVSSKTKDLHNVDIWNRSTERIYVTLPTALLTPYAKYLLYHNNIVMAKYLL